MELVDANTLVYAVERSVPQHELARRWFDRALSGTETLLLPWVSLLAFLRTTTHPRLAATPLDVARACEVVEAWLSQPCAVTPQPDARHLQHVRELLEGAGGRAGNLVDDAHLAALALQWGATAVTPDRDYGRFPGVRWETPTG